MKIKTIDLKYFIIFLFFSLMQERLFFQIDLSLVLIISIIGLIYIICNFKNIISKKYEFKTMILLLLIVEIYGIFLSYFKYNQSIITGLVGTHYIFIYGLYFYFVNLFSKKEISDNLERIKKVFVGFGSFYAILLILQNIVYPNIFLKLNYGIRNGLRIQGCQIIQYAFAIAVCDLINDFKGKKIVPVLIMGYELLVINQARNVILVFSFIILFSYYRKIYDKKKILFLLSLFVIPIILLIMGKAGYFNILSEIVEETQNVQGTSGVRVNELNYYWSKLKESKFMGIGVIGNNFYLKDYILGTNYGYYLEDIGISAFIMKTGILGFLWTIIWIKKLFKTTNKQYEWVRVLAWFVALKTVFSMFFSTSFIFDIRDGLIYFVMILAILDCGRKLEKEKEVN